MMALDTVLEISGAVIPDYAARGATQTLEPIEATAITARTVNGALIDFSPPQMRKYRSTITFKDVEPLALDGIWPGMTVTVDCIPELGFPTSGGSPARTAVPGSTRVAGAWTYYRPRLTMMILKMPVVRDEYGAIVETQIDLEEI